MNNGVTVRGLPMVPTGANFLQLQKDGLPVGEFGDMILARRLGFDLRIELARRITNLMSKTTS